MEGEAATSSDIKAFYGNDLDSAGDCPHGCANWGICVTEAEADVCSSNTVS